MLLIRDEIVAARQRLCTIHGRLRQRHQLGHSGEELCAELAAARDAIVIELFWAAVGELCGQTSREASGIALAAHGGYGRKEVAPFSDVDLMLLYDPRAAGLVSPLSERLVRDLFDAGLKLAHSVRTVAEACRLGCADPLTATSLMDSRLLVGDEKLYGQFVRCFFRRVRQCGRRLAEAISAARMQERIRYGETVFLLEPNVKRSQGGLRDLHLPRWLAGTRYGQPSLDALLRAGILTEEDRQAWQAARQFLLRLRNQLHFEAEQACDVLSRAAQVEVARQWGYQPSAGLLAVEQFMRDYFRHTNAASSIARRVEDRLLSGRRWMRLASGLLARKIAPGMKIGPAGLQANRRVLARLRQNPAEMVRLVYLANLYDVPIAPETWEAIRREALSLPADWQPDAEANQHFVELLKYPARLGALLRDLHEVGLLERFIPQFAPARGLLQFNQYHKYTVDEHCIRAVECAAEFRRDDGPLGRVYRSVAAKHILHLALLIHDLGKGYLEDHREAGLKIAEATADRLQLPAAEAQVLKFLVHRHLIMNHLAFRRDVADEQLVVSFAVQVGSPEVLQMLYVLTAADLCAVGPEVWDGWKQEILTELYHSAMQHLAMDSPATTAAEQIRNRRSQVAAALADQPQADWYRSQIDNLPEGYLQATQPAQIADDLRMLCGLQPNEARIHCQYLPDTNTLQITVGTSEKLTPGIFHKLTGGLSGCGLEIRSAQIYTLPGDLVLDRFWVHDADYAGQPPAERIEQIEQALRAALTAPGDRPPAFRRTWQTGLRPHQLVPTLETRVLCDNSTSQQYTIIDVFTFDRPGLLYAITRTLFELGLSVWRAKIGTYLDQVVDVFYVTDRQGRKLQDEAQLAQIRQRLLEVIGS